MNAPPTGTIVEAAVAAGAASVATVVGDVEITWPGGADVASSGSGGADVASVAPSVEVTWPDGAELDFTLLRRRTVSGVDATVAGMSGTSGSGEVFCVIRRRTVDEGQLE